MNTLSKYYGYTAPDEDDNITLTVVTVKHVVQRALEVEHTHNVAYASVAEMIEDFLIVHWAFPCDRNGRPI